MSATSRAVGSVLFPVPIQLITGVSAALARVIIVSFAVTVSTASVRCFGGEKNIVSGDFAVRIYVKYALFYNVGLVSAHGAVKGAKLAVDVGNAYLVAVDYVYRSDTAAGKSFGDVAAHSAKSEKGNSAGGQLLKRFLP